MTDDGVGRAIINAHRMILEGYSHQIGVTRVTRLEDGLGEVNAVLKQTGVQVPEPDGIVL